MNTTYNRAPTVKYVTHDHFYRIFSQRVRVGMSAFRSVRHRPPLLVRSSRITSGREEVRRPSPHPHLRHQPRRTLRGKQVTVTSLIQFTEGIQLAD